MQVKYGTVWEYSDTFGARPLSQTQSYTRVVGSQSLAYVAAEPFVSCVQIKGQAEIWDVHQKSLVEISMELGSML